MSLLHHAEDYVVKVSTQWRQQVRRRSRFLHSLNSRFYVKTHEGSQSGWIPRVKQAGENDTQDVIWWSETDPLAANLAQQVMVEKLRYKQEQHDRSEVRDYRN